MIYQHLDINGQQLALPVGKAICIGRNYVDHIRELGNEIPEEPVVFIKPVTALVPWSDEVCIPNDRGQVHFECELAVLIGRTINQANPLNIQSESDVQSAIAGVTLALDLTLRDLQNKLKTKGQPWELAKAFDGACPVGRFVALPSSSFLKQGQFRFSLDGELKQAGDCRLMLWPVLEFILWVSQFVTLMPGDLVLTGTPAGVGVLNEKMQLTAELEDLLCIKSVVSQQANSQI